MGTHEAAKVMMATRVMGAVALMMFSFLLVGCVAPEGPQAGGLSGEKTTSDPQGQATTTNGRSDGYQDPVQRAERRGRIATAEMERLSRSNNPVDQEAVSLMADYSLDWLFGSDASNVSVAESEKFLYSFIENRIDFHISEFQETGSIADKNHVVEMSRGNYSEFLEAMFALYGKGNTSSGSEWRPDQEVVDGLIRKQLRSHGINFNSFMT